jgi:hypothetical protein
MHAAAILGPGCSEKSLKPLQADKTIDWRLGMPAASDQADIISVFGGAGTPLAIYADGEFVCRTPAEVRIQRGAVKVLTPQLQC